MYMVRPSTSNAVMRAACASKAPKPAADTMADSTDISSAYRHGRLETGGGWKFLGGFLGLSNSVCIESFTFFQVGLSC